MRPAGQEVDHVHLATAVDVGQALAIIRDAVGVEVRARAAADVGAVVDAVVIAVAQFQEIDVLLAVERRGVGEARFGVLRDHVVVIAELVLLRPADMAVERRAGLDVGRPRLPGVGGIRVVQLGDVVHA
ncbi:MAG: hypothetical protein ACYTBR_16180 [Planctomycetota bacterium]|jgi:hypothetical protein